MCEVNMNRLSFIQFDYPLFGPVIVLIQESLSSSWLFRPNRIAVSSAKIAIVSQLKLGMSLVCRKCSRYKTVFRTFPEIPVFIFLNLEYAPSCCIYPLCLMIYFLKSLSHILFSSNAILMIICTWAMIECLSQIGVLELGFFLLLLVFLNSNLAII